MTRLDYVTDLPTLSSLNSPWQMN